MEDLEFCPFCNNHKSFADFYFECEDGEDECKFKICYECYSLNKTIFNAMICIKSDFFCICRKCDTKLNPRYYCKLI